MSDLTTKDSEQDKQLSVLEYQVSNLERRIEMVHQRIGDTNDGLEALRQRTRKNEMWIAGAGAVIAAATFIIGIAVSADAGNLNKGPTDISFMVHDVNKAIREYESEKTRISPNELLDNALKEWDKQWEQ